MSHPLVLAVYQTSAAAAAAARALHSLGIQREHISVVARTHDEEGALAEQMNATPGADIEDSRAAARLGELGGVALAAIALVMPGIGPIVAAGPLSADLGEAAGHAAGGIAAVLSGAGVAENRAEAIQQEVEHGALLLGVHVTQADLDQVRHALEATGATQIEIANWSEL
jgi:uncharacterized membrane protein